MLPSLLLPRPLPSLPAAIVAAVICMSAIAQQPAAAEIPDVRLEAHDGKTSFYIGEPIQLDLVFENRTGSPFMLNDTIYDDLSDQVEISPEQGWFQWRTTSAHDYASEVKLDNNAPVRVPVRLDEGFVFRVPGEYRVRVMTARLTRGDTLGGAAVPLSATNQVTIELSQMPVNVEAATLTQIRIELAHSQNPTRKQAMRRLATLQGEDALVEKVKLLANGDEDFRAVYREAFATTHDLRRQLALLEQSWTDLKMTPAYDTPDALNETRLLLAGRNLRGWQMASAPHAPDPVEQRLEAEHRADMAALLDSMPKRVGESRTMGAYFLIQFGGLAPAQRARAVDYAVEEFPHMDDTSRHMLLETSRPPLRDPRLVPLLRSMLTANPTDQVAAAALIAMAPAQSATWIVTTVCARKGTVLLDTFKDVAADRVPEVDSCLAPLLRVAPSTPLAEFEWRQRAAAAARFATPAILPSLREGWKSSTQDSAVLPTLLRDDPAAAIQLLNKAAAAGRLDAALFFETSNVYKQIRQPFSNEVLIWLRMKLKSGSSQEAGTAAYALSIGGDGAS